MNPDIPDACNELAGPSAGSPRWAGARRQLAAAVTFTVSGRPGVGVSTVVRALSGARISVGGDGGDVRIRVLAEAANRGPGSPALDRRDRLSSYWPRPICSAPPEPGPNAGAARTAGHGRLDPAVLDDPMLAALRTLTTAPADLSSVDAFVTAPRTSSRSISGNACSTAWTCSGIARGSSNCGRRPVSETIALRRVLREVSGIDAVLSELGVAVAEVRLPAAAQGGRGTGGAGRYRPGCR